MRMDTKLPKQIHNLLMGTPSYRPLYQYMKDGIYIVYGPLKGNNLTKCYSDEPEQVLEYLESIIEHDESSYKMKMITKEVIDDLKNNYGI